MKLPHSASILPGRRTALMVKRLGSISQQKCWVVEKVFSSYCGRCMEHLWHHIIRMTAQKITITTDKDYLHNIHGVLMKKFPNFPGWRCGWSCHDAHNMWGYQYSDQCHRASPPLATLVGNIIKWSKVNDRYPQPSEYAKHSILLTLCEKI